MVMIDAKYWIQDAGTILYQVSCISYPATNIVNYKRLTPVVFPQLTKNLIRMQ